MKILVTPEDIIKRCLWSKYKKYVLNDKKKSEIESIINDNELISLSENDAYVIGLLKVIETDNLVHRFRLEIEEFVKIKTTVNKDRVIINKNSILNEVREFKARFPVEYKPNEYYQKNIDEMKEYVDLVFDQINELPFIEITFKEKEIAFVYSKDVNKIIKFKN
jgi:hypothetical protein